MFNIILLLQNSIVQFLLYWQIRSSGVSILPHLQKHLGLFPANWMDDGMMSDYRAQL